MSGAKLERVSWSVQSMQQEISVLQSQVGEINKAINKLMPEYAPSFEHNLEMEDKQYLSNLVNQLELLLP